MLSNRFCNWNFHQLIVILIASSIASATFSTNFFSQQHLFNSMYHRSLWTELWLSVQLKSLWIKQQQFTNYKIFRSIHERRWFHTRILQRIQSMEMERRVFWKIFYQIQLVIWELRLSMPLDRVPCTITKTRLEHFLLIQCLCQWLKCTPPSTDLLPYVQYYELKVAAKENEMNIIERAVHPQNSHNYSHTFDNIKDCTLLNSTK